MFNMIIPFGLKFLDKFLSTGKTIALIKGKSLTGAILDVLAFSTVVFSTQYMIKVQSLKELLPLALGVFLGSLACKKVAKMFEKDKEYVHMIQIHDSDNSKMIFNKLRDAGLEVISWKSYNDDLEKTLMGIVVTKSKSDFLTLDKLVKDTGATEFTLTDTRRSISN